jgi:ADP-heptose:LPS heptosyltransferase
LADLGHDFKNILVIHFGQLGDVVLALPALKAIRKHFQDANIIALTGKVGGEVVEMSDFADEVIAVDRVELRDGPRLRSIGKMIGLTRDLRKLDLDLVIDLHSLKETNILAWLTRARYRLLANRGNRSYHSLGNFEPIPPPEDRSLQLSRTYMRVLTPLGLDAGPEPIVMAPGAAELDHIRNQVLNNAKRPLAGFFPGAGNPSRCWPLGRFADLAGRLKADGYSPVVFIGPEEWDLPKMIEQTFPIGTHLVDGLSIPQFIAAVSQLAVFVTNDTGPMHLAALAGTPILLVIDSRAPLTYLPLTKRLEVVNISSIEQIPVDEVYVAARNLLSTAAK